MNEIILKITLTIHIPMPPTPDGEAMPEEQERPTDEKVNAA